MLRWFRSYAVALHALAALTILGTAPLRAAPLEELTSTWKDARLSVQLEATGSRSVEQGADFAVTVRSTQDARVAFLLVDRAGQVRAFVPNRRRVDDRIAAGESYRFPDVTQGESLYADLAEGDAQLLVVAMQKSVLTDVDWAIGDPPPWVDAKTVAAELARSGVGPLAIARVPLRIVAPQIREEITAREFVEYFAQRTRSVRGAGMGIRIGFNLDSAELTDWSRRHLDAVGRAMQDAQVGEMRFMLEGHTDNLGDPLYNLSLSERRAAAVRRYLVETAGVSEARLDAVGFGMDKPMTEGDSEDARRQNRRVIIRRLDR